MCKVGSLVMAKNNIIKKKDIQPSDIKANIYDSVKVFVDVHGITRLDIEAAQEALKKILPAENYSMVDDSFGIDEINEYGDRNNLAQATRKRYLDTESVIRFFSKDNTETIIISRLFIGITLTYEVAHTLKDNIGLMSKIIDVFQGCDYFEVQRIALLKSDSIYCSSLYRLYQCFDKKLFADAGYEFKLKAKLKANDKNIDTGFTQIYNNFTYEDVNVVVNKKIISGWLSDTDENIFEGHIDTFTATDSFGESVDVEEILLKLNDVSFEVFICHITDSFARELVAGKSNKVRKGLNNYE